MEKGYIKKRYYSQVGSNRIIVVDIDVAALYLYLTESTCRPESCCSHQNRFPDHSLCYIDDNVFAAVGMIAVIVAVLVVAAVADLSVQDNHAVH